jgi:glutamate N-acetyltransferase / amino-acid N-acetyltransferase
MWSLIALNFFCLTARTSPLTHCRLKTSVSIEMGIKASFVPAFKGFLSSKMQSIPAKHHRYYTAPFGGTIPAAKQKYVPTSGNYPKGFLVSATHVGVKPTNKSTPDLAFVTSERPCAAAAVFTKNKFQAAPVTFSRDMLKRRGNNGVRSVIINSGCANAVTGRGGLQDAEKMGAEADKCFGQPTDGKGGSTIVMSTGVIGQR